MWPLRAFRLCQVLLGKLVDLLRFILTKGIAGGTLLYVVMFEVLNRERTKNVSGLLQLAGILVGFASMLMIEIFGEFISLIR